MTCDLTLLISFLAVLLFISVTQLFEFLLLIFIFVLWDWLLESVFLGSRFIFTLKLFVFTSLLLFSLFLIFPFEVLIDLCDIILISFRALLFWFGSVNPIFSSKLVEVGFISLIFFCWTELVVFVFELLILFILCKFLSDSDLPFK